MKITCDSRQVEPGDTFVAIKGHKDDGHNYISEAIANGASMIFCEEDYPQQEVPIIKVENSRELLGKLAANHYSYPSKEIDIIGITGTNGKTTTTHLIYQLLNFEKKQAGLIGTVSVDNGKDILPGKLTTPTPVNLQQSLRDMINNDLKFACMEVSSHGIKLDRIANTEYAVKVGTNITPDHFDLHPDFSSYRKVKQSFLETDKPETLVLLNNDDSWLNRMHDIAPNLISYAIYHPATVQAENIKRENLKTIFDYSLSHQLKTKDGQVIEPFSFKISTYLQGIHNIYNILIATTIALYYGIKPEHIQAFFKEFKGVWRRMEIIYHDDFTVIDDCAHNPGSYDAVLSALKELDNKRYLIVNSLRGNRGTRINHENAKTIANKVKELKNYLLLTCSCYDTAAELDCVTSEEEGIFLQTLEKNSIPYNHFQELEPALFTVLENVEPNDAIILLGPHAMDQAAKKLMELMSIKKY